jgi:hypothetical protein
VPRWRPESSNRRPMRDDSCHLHHPHPHLMGSALPTRRPAAITLHAASAALRADFAAFGYRLLNWKLRRALARPYFLRSTTRLSRVRKPARFTVVRNAGS